MVSFFDTELNPSGFALWNRYTAGRSGFEFESAAGVDGEQ
jgi:hypothetical protein